MRPLIAKTPSKSVFLSSITFDRLAASSDRTPHQTACSDLEQQALEDLEKALKDAAVRVRQAHDEATAVAGGEALVQCRRLQNELSEQSVQVLVAPLEYI